MTFKKFFVLCSLMIFICTPKVEAKIVTDKLPLLTYAEAPVPVYDAPGGTKKGTITTGNSLVLVKVIRPDGWAYGSYKVLNQKKRVYCWFQMNELQGYADFENYTEHTNYDTNAYRTRLSSRLVGKIASDEDIIVVAKRGDKVKVIFKADGNYYRMGWLNKSNLSANSRNSNLDADYYGDDTESEGDYDSEDIESEGDYDGEDTDSENNFNGGTIASYDGTF